MNAGLRQLIETRLESNGIHKTSWARLVLVAGYGPQALESYLRDGQTPPDPIGPQDGRAAPGGAYLASLTVEGFRGIGPPRTVAFEPGPGLTLVVGRNGSGKSSFAEAFEVLLTGDSRRWAGRSRVWRDGWRSLHHPHPARIEAEMIVEGQGPTKVAASWDAGAPLESARTVVQPRGRPKTTIEGLGWTAALEAYRPFLSYNELGSALDDGPSTLYDTLSSVLGLDDLVTAQKALADARTARQRALKAADDARRQLIERVKALRAQEDDDRLTACLEALDSPAWGLDQLERLIDPGAVPPDDGVVAILAAAVALQVPAEEAVAAAVQALREAHARLLAVAGTEPDRARRLCQLLQSALEFHERHKGDDCPVCGASRALGPGWAEATSTEIGRLRELARESEEAHTAAARARSEALKLMPPPPELLDKLFEIGLDGLDVAREAWTIWHSGASVAGLPDLADHLDAHYQEFARAIAALKTAAASELQRRQDRWKPVADAIRAWLPGARQARRGAEDLKRIVPAEEWLKTTTGDIRDERFAPIADRAMATWQFLRQNSHVELGRIELTGTKSQRRVTLDVTVDGVAGAALGVMSQGELHSLALSLFLPRATLADSPFRFVVIDDPVQSMDPARVDGLAMALDDLGRTRQVIVFTHDDRLPEAVRRLGIRATVLGVTRRPKSFVEVRRSIDPVRAHIEDALALVHTTDLPRDVLRRLVPGFCRLALEASFVRIVRRRRLAAGTPHAEVEDELKKAGKLAPVAALALFGDANRGGDVMTHLNNKFGQRAGSTFKLCNEGVHTGIEMDLHPFVTDTEWLAERLLEVA